MSFSFRYLDGLVGLVMGLANEKLDIESVIYCRQLIGVLVCSLVVFGFQMGAKDVLAVASHGWIFTFHRSDIYFIGSFPLFCDLVAGMFKRWIVVDP